MRIEYAPNGNVIRKPLIVVEGFDAGKIIKPESQFGLASIDDFLKNVRDDNFLVNGVLTQTQLDALLEGDNQEYDLIYVDYLDGTDDIERNAKLVEDVINYVNTNKAAVGGVMQANVVLGISMGGLCSRLALKNMETANQNHQTRLFITWDSPHQGSNVPQGVQHLVRHASDIYISTGLTAGVLDMRIPLLMNGLQPRRVFKLADEPASKQMLINRVAPDNSIDNTTHDDWQGDLTTLGHPEGFTGSGGFAFDRIAVSNGSECALTQGFDPGDNLIHLQGDAMNVGMLSDIIARLGMPLVGAVLNQPSITFYGGMPGRNKFKVTLNVHSKALSSGNQVYQLKMEYTKQLFNLINISTVLTDRTYNANASTLPYDYYPGGNINIGEYGIDEQELNNWFYRYNISASNEPAFCFVPVPSALDIGEGNVALTHGDYLTPYRGAVPPTGTKSSPFDGFITAFNGSPDNEKHVLIERRNGDWIAGWLNNNQPVPLNCSFVCSNPTITGPGYFCSSPSGAYSVSGLPSGASISWSSSNSLIASPNTPNGPGTTFQMNGSGSITVSAFIDGCGALEIKKENVIVGAPQGIGIVQYSNLQACETDGYYEVLPSNPVNYYYYSGSMEVATSGGVATNISWSLVPGSSGSGWAWSANGNTVSVYTQSSGLALHLRATSSNACGSVYKDYHFYTGGCVSESLIGGGGEESASLYSISPNPSTGSFSATLKSTSDSKASIKEIVIQNKFGFEVKRIKFSNSSKTQQVNIGSLPPDIYIVRIYDGKSWVSIKIAKE